MELHITQPRARVYPPQLQVQRAWKLLNVHCLSSRSGLPCTEYMPSLHPWHKWPRDWEASHLPAHQGSPSSWETVQYCSQSDYSGFFLYFSSRDFAVNIVWWTYWHGGDKKHFLPKPGWPWAFPSSVLQCNLSALRMFILEEQLALPSRHFYSHYLICSALHQCLFTYRYVADWLTVSCLRARNLLASPSLGPGSLTLQHIGGAH